MNPASTSEGAELQSMLLSSFKLWSWGSESSPIFFSDTFQSIAQHPQIGRGHHLTSENSNQVKQMYSGTKDTCFTLHGIRETNGQMQEALSWAVPLLSGTHKLWLTSCMLSLFQRKPTRWRSSTASLCLSSTPRRLCRPCCPSHPRFIFRSSSSSSDPHFWETTTSFGLQITTLSFPWIIWRYWIFTKACINCMHTSWHLSIWVWILCSHLQGEICDIDGTCVDAGGDELFKLTTKEGKLAVETEKVTISYFPWSLIILAHTFYFATAFYPYWAYSVSPSGNEACCWRKCTLPSLHLQSLWLIEHHMHKCNSQNDFRVLTCMSAAGGCQCSRPGFRPHLWTRPRANHRCFVAPIPQQHTAKISSGMAVLAQPES